MSKEKDLVQNQFSKKELPEKNRKSMYKLTVNMLIKYILNCTVYVDMIRKCMDCFKILEFCL